MAAATAKKVPAPSMSAEEKRWRTEEDLRTITRAREIQRDPARMKAVRALAAEQLKSAAATASSLKGESK